MIVDKVWQVLVLDPIFFEKEKSFFSPSRPFAAIVGNFPGVQLTRKYLDKRKAPRKTAVQKALTSNSDMIITHVLNARYVFICRV